MRMFDYMVNSEGKQMNTIISIMNFANHSNQALDHMCYSLIEKAGFPIQWEFCQEGNISEVHKRRFNGYKEYDILVAIDIDCFITNVAVLNYMCEHMLNKGIVFAAMNEKCGPSTHRNKCYGLTGNEYNAFFYVLNTALVPEVQDVKELDKKYRDSEFKDTNRIEPYWSMFQSISNLKHIDLQGYTHTDGITTVLDWEGDELLRHSWYARYYDLNAIESEAKCNHKERIDKVYKEVLDARGALQQGEVR